MYVKEGVAGEYTGVGSAGMEAEFLDSMSNERIGAAMDKKPAEKQMWGSFPLPRPRLNSGPKGCVYF